MSNTNQIERDLFRVSKKRPLDRRALSASYIYFINFRQTIMRQKKNIKKERINTLVQQQEKTKFFIDFRTNKQHEYHCIFICLKIFDYG